MPENKMPDDEKLSRECAEQKSRRCIECEYRMGDFCIKQKKGKIPAEWRRCEDAGK